jgi:2-oxoglutarate ferredoxin oxidoreductase subunit alpha
VTTLTGPARPDALPAPGPAAPERILMKGNEALAEAAIQAGCDAYFGYPITPQAELLEWMARRMPELGRAFVQAESELGAINMGLGAAATGARVLVSTSSPGFSLMAEAMSYLAGSEIPLVLVNVMRGGPGLGSIGPAQADYLQAVKGHGHGDYRVPVLAPTSIDEAMELMADGFELGEQYRTPVIILLDGILGQAIEPVTGRFRNPERRPGDWEISGADGRPPRVVKSLHLQPEALEAHNLHLQAKFARIAEREVRWAGEALEDAEVVIVAYGTAARVARTAVAQARAAGLRVGLFRPITLWPFPEKELRALAGRVRGLLVVELSAGQLVEDVRLAVEGGTTVLHHGRTGGMVPSPAEVVTALRHLWSVTTPRGGSLAGASLEAEADPFSLVEAGMWAAAGHPLPEPPAGEPGEPDPLSLVDDADWIHFREACRERDQGPGHGSDRARDAFHQPVGPRPAGGTLR